MAHTAEQAERLKQYRAGVRADGTVEGYLMETHIACIYAIRFPQQYGFHVDFENKFIEFTTDGHGIDYAVRLPFETVASMQKWIDAGPDKAVG